MEIGAVYIIGLIMGIAAGMAFKKKKKFEEPIEISEETGVIIDSPEKFKEFMDKFNKEPIPPTGGSGESKKDTMTQKELFDKYLTLAEKWQYANMQGDQKRQELLGKAERILDTAGYLFQPAIRFNTDINMAINSADPETVAFWSTEKLKNQKPPKPKK